MVAGALFEFDGDRCGESFRSMTGDTAKQYRQGQPEVMVAGPARGNQGGAGLTTSPGSLNILLFPSRDRSPGGNRA